MDKNQEKHDLGDAPLEEQYREIMLDVARILDRIFNPEGSRDVGFVLLLFPYGEKEGRCTYISNGADRTDIAKLFREQAERFEKDARNQDVRKDK